MKISSNTIQTAIKMIDLSPKTFTMLRSHLQKEPSYFFKKICI